MADQDDPWARDDQPSPKRRWNRVLIWIALALAVTVGLLELSRLFPGAVSKDDEPHLVYMIGWLALLSAGLVFSRRIRATEALRNIAIWVAIAALLVIGYSYRDVLAPIGARIQSELLPGNVVVTGDHLLTLTRDDGGDFYIYGSSSGTRIRFLVDTGASDIVLAPADAKRLGIDTAALHYLRGYETANGTGAGAPYVLHELSIGPIRLPNVAVMINQTDMGASLLGMAFLKRTKSFEFRGNNLLIRW